MSAGKNSEAPVPGIARADLGGVERRRALERVELGRALGDPRRTVRRRAPRGACARQRTHRLDRDRRARAQRLLGHVTRLPGALFLLEHRIDDGPDGQVQVTYRGSSAGGSRRSTCASEKGGAGRRGPRRARAARPRRRATASEPSDCCFVERGRGTSPGRGPAKLGPLPYLQNESAAVCCYWTFDDPSRAFAFLFDVEAASRSTVSVRPRSSRPVFSREFVVALYFWLRLPIVFGDHVDAVVVGVDGGVSPMFQPGAVLVLSLIVTEP